MATEIAFENKMGFVHLWGDLYIRYLMVHHSQSDEEVDVLQTPNKPLGTVIHKCICIRICKYMYMYMYIIYIHIYIYI